MDALAEAGMAALSRIRDGLESLLALNFAPAAGTDVLMLVCEQERIVRLLAAVQAATLAQAMSAGTPADAGTPTPAPCSPPSSTCTPGRPGSGSAVHRTTAPAAP